MNIVKTMLFFDTMITPKVLQFLYWLALIIVILLGVVSIIGGQFLHGVLMIVISPILYRITFELIMVVFKNNEYLKKIADK